MSPILPRMSVLFVFIPSLVGADEGIPAKTLSEIKAATVFVKYQHGSYQGSGSGFVIHTNGDVALIATNEHVVGAKPVSSKHQPKCEVVFNSGRKSENSVAAEIICADRVRDLAILRVKGMDLPKPIDVNPKLELAETMTIYIVGFPFGEDLSPNNGNPAPTIGKGTISSLRENEQGELSVVQIEGEVHPGNSGGPVVDSKGQSIGITVAKVRNTRIGMAIPTRELNEIMLGRVDTVDFQVNKFENGFAEIRVKVAFADPLNKISKAAVRVGNFPVSSIPIKRDKSGITEALPNSQTHELKIDNKIGTATFRLKATDRPTVTRYLAQPVVFRDKVEVNSPLQFVRVENRP